MDKNETAFDYMLRLKEISKNNTLIRKYKYEFKHIFGCNLTIFFSLSDGFTFLSKVSGSEMSSAFLLLPQLPPL